MRRYLILGNGVAGLSGAIGIREQDAQGEITLIGDEAHPPYYRAGLSEWMHGAIDDDELRIRPEAELEALDLKQITGRAKHLDVEGHTITLEDGASHPWDKLLIATGAAPILPPWPGAELDGVFTYRTWEDCAALKAVITARPEVPVVIVGAGILGLEFAWDCKGLGVPAVLLVRGSKVGRPIFDGAVSEKLLQRLRDDGVTVHLEEEVDHLEDIDGKLVAVVTQRGRRIECNTLVAATGVKPDLSLLTGSEILTDRWIKVDGHLRTSHPDVFAAGDVATVFDTMLQTHAPTRTWEPSYWGGRTAGVNMAGGSKPYVPCTTVNASLVYDLKYVLLGGFLGHGAKIETITDSTPQGRYGHRELLLDEDDVVVGGTFLSDSRHMLAYRQLMQTRVKVTEFKDRLLHADFDPNLALPAGSLDYYFF